MDREADLVKEVPDTLQRLIRFIARGFYGIEHGLVIDVLVRNACVKEEDIQELLKFDKKQLRTMLVTLKNDKLLNTRFCVETQPDGKVLRHNYYYINYRSLCNVINYKLHHIQKRIETQERDVSNRASFKCPTCQNTYSDLEVNFLMDPITGLLNCNYCGTEVEEDTSGENVQDSRRLQAKFNEQMEPIYKMLKETENVRLALEVLEPEPTFIPHLHTNGRPTAPRSRQAGEKQSGSGHWTDVKTPGVDYHQDVIINLGDNAADEDKAKPKEVPIWIQQSTIRGSDPTSAAISSISNESPRAQSALSTSTNSRNDNDEIMATLMMQERRSKPQAGASRYSDDNRSDSSGSGADGVRKDQDDDDDDDDDFEEVDDNDPVVMVAGKQYTYSEVVNNAQELVQLMTPAEKRAYIEIGQQMYEDMDH